MREPARTPNEQVRIVIDDVRPRTPAGYPAKATVGEVVPVSADVLADGHDVLAARARARPVGGDWGLPVPLHDVGEDRFEGALTLPAIGAWELVVDAWRDRWATWRRDVRLKAEDGQDVEVEREEGARLLEALRPQVAEAARSLLDATVAELRAGWLDTALDDDLAGFLDGVALPGPGEVTVSQVHPVWVDREQARFSTWYELFPRSELGLAGVRKRLPELADLGFDVVYLPPVHPIGRTARKGRDGALVAGPGDPGSPWAIGGREGGHTAIAPELGTLDDLDDLVAEARGLGMEVALDYALQCSPDHPWVSEHPEWFTTRPDGSIKTAENPPKRYQDIYPIDFWPAAEEDRRALWEACRDVLAFWVDRGIRTFRVDNPHTKPLAFWEWVIPEIKAASPDVLFLAEAFTRPKLMAKLAEVGFSTSYTYFTWRTGKAELAEYVTELSRSPSADVLRPMFWPNTPDILSGPLRHGSPGAFRLRLLLAATLVPAYGIYSGYELCENEPASEANEEYLHSEKYEVKRRDWGAPGPATSARSQARSLPPARSQARSLSPFIGRVNEIRRAHPALQVLRGITFHPSSNDRVLAYSRRSMPGGDVVLCVVNLDPDGVQEDTLQLDLVALGVQEDEAFDAHDELTGATFEWRGPSPYIRLDPAVAPGHVLSIRRPPERRGADDNRP